jgi:hypothetical protein
MKYHQKDIVEIDFPIPGEGYKVYPALIVSNDELQLDEGFVYVALISSLLTMASCAASAASSRNTSTKLSTR